MLKIIRTNTKTLIWIFITLFILWCIGSAVTSGRDQKPAAKVFNKKINRQEYEEFYKIVFYSPKYQELFASNAVLPDRFLMDTTLQYIALYYYAKKHGVRATDSEVRDEIYKRFSPNGIFNQGIYERWIRNIYQGPSRKFEEGIRKEKIIFKFLDSIREQIKISDEEIQNAIEVENTQFILKYLVFPTENYSGDIAFTDSDIEQYFKENKNEFKIPDKYDINYIPFDASSFLKDVFVAEDEIETFYNQAKQTAPNPDNFPPLENARSRIEKELLNRKARRSAQEKAGAVEKRIQNTKNFGVGVKEAGVDAIRTGPKTAKEISQILGNTTTLIDDLPRMSPSSVRSVHGNAASFVILLTKKEYGYAPPLIEVKEKVVKTYKDHRKSKAAEENVRYHLERLRNNEVTAEALAETLGLSWQQPEPFSIANRAIPELGALAPLINALSPINPTDYLDPYLLPNAFALIQLLEKRTPSEDFIEKNLPQYRTRLEGIKANQLMGQEIKKVLTEAKIQNYLIKESEPFADIR